MSVPEVKKFYDPAQALKDIRSYHTDISVDLMRQGGLFARYSALLVQAESQLDRYEHTVDVVAAKLDASIREEAATAGTKMTESQIKASITTDRNMRALQEAVRQAREQVGYLKGTCEALRQRKDALMQVAMLSREELKGSPTVMGTANKENRHERMKRISDPDVVIE